MTALLIVLMYLSSAVTAIFFIVWLGSPQYWSGFLWLSGEIVVIALLTMIAFMVLVAMQEDSEFFQDWSFSNLFKW